MRSSIPGILNRKPKEETWKSGKYGNDAGTFIDVPKDKDDNSLSNSGKLS